MKAVRGLACLLCILLTSKPLLAQNSEGGTIAGVARDASGAVLPGVTVEAASDALIERTRATITDGNGQYRIVNLRPGTYTVTFTLSGFTSYKRDGLGLSGTATLTVNGQMNVGTVEETVVVSGQTPTVDVQSTNRERALSADVVAALPTSRMYYTLGVLLPGVVSSTRDVGGATGSQLATLTIHGGQAGDQRITQNGMNLAGLRGGNVTQVVADMSAVQEVVIDTSGFGADRQTGGVYINFIPRDGGNRLTGSIFLTGVGENQQANNFTQDLIDQGMVRPTEFKKNWDINPSVGGPLRKNKLWYYITVRNFGAQVYADMFYNKNEYLPNVWQYEADRTRPALARKAKWWDEQGRFTWQINSSNKLASTVSNQTKCECPGGINSVVSPEAGWDDRAPVQRMYEVDWSSQLGSRILLEAAAQRRFSNTGFMDPRPQSQGGSLPDGVEAIYPSLIGVTQTNGGGVVPNNLAFHGPSGTFSNGGILANSYRWAVSFISGRHALKVGATDTMGYVSDGPDIPTRDVFGRPLRYRFARALTPDQVTFYHSPYKVKTNMDHDFGAYVQDRWTMNRLTLNLGVRYDWFVTSYPASTLPASMFGRPALSFEGGKNLNWKDWTPRTGLAYDLFGKGKTAIKGSLNKYVAGNALNGIASSAHPLNRLSGTDSGSRTWTDLNGDFIVDCDLANRQPNGECPSLGPQFSTVPSPLNDLNVRTGWGVRGFDWEVSTGVQQQLAKGISADVSYFRRWYGNFTTTDNLALGPSDFQRFDITAPVDSRLPNGGGYVIPGFYDFVSADAATRAANNQTIFSDSIGTQIRHWNGVDVTVNGRLPWMVFMGGTSSGRELNDNCAIVAALPENVGGNPFCRTETPLLTQYKGLAALTLPKYAALPDVLERIVENTQVAATFQNIPGSAMTMTYAMTTAEINQLPNAALGVGSTLGRALANNATTKSVRLLDGTELYDERLNQLDLRFGRLLRIGRMRTSLNVDVYNVFNANPVSSRNNTLGKSATPGSYATAQVRQADGLYHSVWTPTGILQARFFKVGAQIDF